MPPAFAPLRCPGLGGRGGICVRVRQAAGDCQAPACDYLARAEHDVTQLTHFTFAAIA